MRNTLYFKKMNNGLAEKIYRVEENKMFIEILDKNHPCGSPIYFSSPHARNNYIDDIKSDVLRINHDEVSNIVNGWNLR